LFSLFFEPELHPIHKKANEYSSICNFMFFYLSCCF